MKRFTTTLLSLVLSAQLIANGEVLTNDKDQVGLIKQKISQRLVNTPIEKVVQSVEFPSLYEVHSGPNIFFTDEKSDFIMIGHVFDMNGTDLTQIKLAPKIEAFRKKAIEEQAKEQELINKKYLDAKKDIDLTKALKIGQGKHEVVVFTNSECHFCRDSERMIEGGDMTKYVFFTTFLAPQASKPKSIHVLCSKTPEKEYAKMMRGELDGKPLLSCEKGEKRLDEMMREASKLDRFGTPLFFIDNNVVNGANSVIKNMVK